MSHLSTGPNLGRGIGGVLAWVRVDEPAPFTPLSLEGLLNWWAAEDCASVGDWEPVPLQTARASGLVASSITDQEPYFVANAGDGLPALDWDGTDDQAHLPSAVMISELIGLAANEVWVRIKPGTGTAGRILEATSVGADSVYLSQVYYDAIRLFTPTFDDFIAVDFPSGWLDAWHTVRFVREGTARTIECDGVTLFDSPSSEDPIADQAAFYNGIFTGFIGQSRHLLSFNRRLTSDEAGLMRSYLSAN